MDINQKRELRRFSDKFKYIAEPFLIIAIILVFVLPIFAVINLSPETKAIPNVLGATDSNDVIVTSIQGKHSVIKDEIFNKISDGVFTYNATIGNHSGGIFSKPIYQIKNNTETDTTIDFSGATSTNRETKIGIINHISNVNYILQSEQGELFSHSITLKPNEETSLYLSIDTANTINYDDTVKITLALHSVIK